MAQGVLLKKLVDAVRELCREVNWDVGPTGISMQSMDSSHVCLANFSLTSEGFELFRCDRPGSLGIDLENLAKILKCSGAGDSITMRAADDGDKLTLVFENESRDRVSEFDLKLMSIESEHLGVSDADYAATVTMPSAEYQRIVRDLATIGDSAAISVSSDEGSSNGSIKFAVYGDVGNASVTVKGRDGEGPSDASLVAIDVEESVSLTFGLRYLVNFAKATPLAASVQLALGKDLPARVKYEIDGVGDVTYYLAPKMSDDDQDDADADAEEEGAD